MKKFLLVSTLFLALYSVSIAQNGLTRWDSLQVTISGDTLTCPWAGGLNCPQFSAIDLDGDGIQDLFVFDRDGNKVLTFLNKGTPNKVDYHYAPQYAHLFPNLHDFALLVDYNCDGKPDIFTYSNGGMAVYRNDFSASSGLSFTLVTSLLRSLYPGSAGYTNLWVSPTNLPAFCDVDDDGDIDIIALDIGGGLIEYHKNMSIETYGTCDSLWYNKQSGCWGNCILSSSSNSATLGAGCRVSPDSNILPEDGIHNGFTFLCLDLDGNHTKELVVGDLGFNNLLMLKNGGTPPAALFTTQDVAFPQNNVSTSAVNLTSMPGAYYLDVDNDGIKDLIVAPSSPWISENFTSVWYYKNSGTNLSPQFNFIQNNFLQDRMIETGEGNNPAFFDADGDGKLDLIIGNYGYFSPSGTYTSELSFYKNTGTAANPSFDLVTRDYAGVSALAHQGLYPAFGDLDGDGDMDMLLGNSDGKLDLYSNIAATGAPANFVLTAADYMGIDVGANSAPQIIDLNRDGKPDLVIGKRNGTLSYFKNISTGLIASFNAAPTSSNLGGINLVPPSYVTAYTSPWIYDSPGGYKMVLGSEAGLLYSFYHIDGNLSGAFALLDSSVIDRYEGGRISVSGGDLNGDGKMDLVIGNYLGGCAIFRNDNFTGIAEKELSSKEDLRFYPNPADESVLIKTGKDGAVRTVEIYSLAGQLVSEKKVNTNNIVLDTKDMPSGFYFCRIIFPDNTFTGRFVVAH